MSGLSGAEALKLAQSLWKTMVQGKGYERILNQVIITSAGQGTCVAEFKVEEGMTNRGGTLHGGCTATLIDCISTIGLMTGKSLSPGVSVNLSVSYLKAAPEGEVIVIDSKTVKSGKKLAFLETVLKNKKNGEIIATGNHLKFIAVTKETKCVWHEIRLLLSSQFNVKSEIDVTLNSKMSTQKGNINRTRAQKHQNKTKFKNDLHDKSHTTKMINSLKISNVCIRCKNIIEWKVKYKKYKPLKSPATCVKCHGKNVKHAYHTICSECSTKLNVCPKCGQNLVTSASVKNVEELLKASEVQIAIKALSERRRRTFYRHLNNSFNPETEEEILEKLKGLSLSNAEEKCEFDISDSDLDD